MYAKDIMITLFQNGLISAIPYICNFLAIIIAGQISDYARCRRLCSTEVARKIANSTGEYESFHRITFKNQFILLIFRRL